MFPLLTAEPQGPHIIYQRGRRLGTRDLEKTPTCIGIFFGKGGLTLTVRGPQVHDHNPVLHDHGPVLDGHGPYLQCKCPVLLGNGPVLHGHGSGLQHHGLVLHGHNPIVQFSRAMVQVSRAMAQSHFCKPPARPSLVMKIMHSSLWRDCL